MRQLLSIVQASLEAGHLTLNALHSCQQFRGRRCGGCEASLKAGQPAMPNCLQLLMPARSYLQLLFEPAARLQFMLLALVIALHSSKVVCSEMDAM